MIGNRSLIENSEPVQTLAPATYNSNGNGSSVNLSGSTAWMFEIAVGAWTNGSHTIHFEESEDGSTWTAIAAADLDGYDIDGTDRLATGGQTYEITDATKDGRVDLVAYIGGQQHLRARREGSGATGAAYSVTVWKLGLRHAGRNPMRSNW